MAPPPPWRAPRRRQSVCTVLFIARHHGSAGVAAFGGSGNCTPRSPFPSAPRVAPLRHASAPTVAGGDGVASTFLSPPLPPPTNSAPTISALFGGLFAAAALGGCPRTTARHHRRRTAARRVADHRHADASQARLIVVPTPPATHAREQTSHASAREFFALSEVCSLHLTLCRPCSWCGRPLAGHPPRSPAWHPLSTVTVTICATAARSLTAGCYQDSTSCVPSAWNPPALVAPCSPPDARSAEDPLRARLICRVGGRLTSRRAPKPRDAGALK